MHTHALGRDSRSPATAGLEPGVCSPRAVVRSCGRQARWPTSLSTYRFTPVLSFLETGSDLTIPVFSI